MSKKSNNKGYFLAETIVVIALVTSVMAYVFPNVTKVYDNYNNRSKYYDQTEDVYNLKTIYEFMKESYYSGSQGNCGIESLHYNPLCSNFKWIEYYTLDTTDIDSSKFETYPDNTGVGCKKFPDNTLNNELSEFENSKRNLLREFNIEKIYLTGYLTAVSVSDDYNFNKYLNRLKKNTSDSSSYRLIAVINEGGKTRYASIKVDNPNSKRNCNLGGS